MPAIAFPDDDALCESCGYPLRELPREADCPECGQAIAESDPVHRRGLEISHRSPALAYAATVRALAWHPKRFFRQMRLDGSNAWPRLFLLIHAVLATLVWLGTGLGVAYFDTGVDNLVMYWMSGMLVFNLVLVLTYIEVLGVTLFSARRGWRMPMRLAERVACYASVGWVPAAVITAAAWQLGPRGVPQLWRAVGGASQFATEAAFTAGIIATVLGLVVFESTVWLGVRQVKFANGPARPAQPPATVQPNT